jgi:hypothetical protein
MPGIVDRPVTAEVPGMLGDNLIAEADDNPVGIGTDLDGTPRGPRYDYGCCFLAARAAILFALESDS